MEAIEDERTDEIIVSTFGRALGWLRRDLVGRLRSRSGLPIQHVVVDVLPTEVARLMTTHAEALHDHEHHAPPAANQSSRVDARTLGMPFIRSEIMLFGSFFAAYFFVRW